MWQDLRFGFRTLAKSKGFSAVAIAALGIGANATVFSLANGILFKCLPFHDSDKVRYVTSQNMKNPRGPDGISRPGFQDLRQSERRQRDAREPHGRAMRVDPAIALRHE